MHNSANRFLEIEVESTYTAALWVETDSGEQCIRLKSGLSHDDAGAFAEAAADAYDAKSDRPVIAVSVLLDRAGRT